MNIRPAEQEDVPHIVKLIGDVWAEYGCILDTDVEEQYLLTPAEYFHAKNGEFWVVEEAGRIIATCAVQMHNLTTAELKSLYVNKDFRKHGLGRRLTEMATDFSKAFGAMEIILWSDTRFVQAHRLYRSLGFALSGKRDLQDLNNTTEFGFRKSLSIIAETSFEDAEKQFKNFLAGNYLPGELLWLFEEDTYRRTRDGNMGGAPFWIKLPLLYENDDLVKEMYKKGQAGGFGICFHAYALCRGQACCGLIIPKDSAEAGDLQVPDKFLKFSFTASLAEAFPIESYLKWKMFDLFPAKYQPGNFFSHLPAKKNLQFPRD